MVSGAELRSEWSVLSAGSTFVTYRTNYLLSSHCQGPMFSATDWALWGLLLLMASAFTLAVIPCVLWAVCGFTFSQLGQVLWIPLFTPTQA